MLGQNLNLKLRDKKTVSCILHTQIRSKFHFLSDGKSVLLTGVAKFLIEFHWSRSLDVFAKLVWSLDVGLEI